MKKFAVVLIAILMMLSMVSGAVAEEKLYIPVIARGFQHQFFQTVYQGAQDAARDYDVEIYFDGPASETNIDEQVEMLKSEMAKNPKVLALDVLSIDAVMTELQECIAKNIPIIAFDGDVPNAPEGAIYATVCTDNENAAMIAAEKFMEQEGFADMLREATAENPVVIAVISQDATSRGITQRTTGFVEKMKELASAYNTVSVTGHDLWRAEVDGAGVIISVHISATTEAADVANTSAAVLNLDNLRAVFLTNEGAVNGFLAATADGSELAEGGRYEGLLAAGFDAGITQKNAVRQGWFIGSVTQDPYALGYKTVELAVKVVNGEEVTDIETEARWYNAENMDDPEMAMLLYD